MKCPICKNHPKKCGRDRKGKQRYRCLTCGRTFQRTRRRILGGKLLPPTKAVSVLEHLIEGCSIRSTGRLTKVHRDTVLRLLRMTGDQCELLMLELIGGLAVQDVECDELWSFIKMKSKTKLLLEIESNDLGDAWVYSAFERNTKLVLAWHLGQRCYEDTVLFMEKLRHATSGRFQITTDGFKPYRDAVPLSLGSRKVDFPQLVKTYGTTRTGVRSRYTGSVKEVICGKPDLNRVSTSAVERQNLSIRMETRRFTRKTNGFSKKCANHHAALAFYFAYYNFCRVHRTLKKTPAMAANLTDSVWTLKNLLSAATQL